MRVFAFFLLLTMATSSVVDIESCKTIFDQKCTIVSIHVGAPCINETDCPPPDDVRISYDFVPLFYAENLTSIVTRYGGPALEWESDACKETTCPVYFGKMQRYFSSKNIEKNLEPGNYTFRWQLFNPKDKYNNMCCIQTIVSVPI